MSSAKGSREGPLFYLDQTQTFSNISFKAITGNQLTDGINRIRPATEFGKALGRRVKGSVFVDLGCGDPARSSVPITIARSLGAKKYIGVDIELPDNNSLRRDRFANYEKSDVLEFLRGLVPQRRRYVFYIAGLEPIDRKDETTKRYINDCLQEIERVTKSGDAVVIGVASSVFSPRLNNFRSEAHYPPQVSEHSPRLTHVLYVRK